MKNKLKKKIFLENLAKFFSAKRVYSEQELKIAIEFGIVLSEVAKENKKELTPEMSTRAEEILINELKTSGLQKTALNFIPLILSVFEV